MIAGLLSPDKKKVMKNAMLKFIANGLRFVFPAELGAIVRGMATGHSAPVLKEFFLPLKIMSGRFHRVNPKGNGSIRYTPTRRVRLNLIGICMICLPLLMRSELARRGNVRRLSNC